MHQVQEVLESWSEGSNRGKGQNVYVSSPKKRTHRAWQSRQRAGEDSAWGRVPQPLVEGELRVPAGWRPPEMTWC